MIVLRWKHYGIGHMIRCYSNVKTLMKGTPVYLDMSHHPFSMRFSQKVFPHDESIPNLKDTPIELLSLTKYDLSSMLSRNRNVIVLSRVQPNGKMKLERENCNDLIQFIYTQISNLRTISFTHHDVLHVRTGDEVAFGRNGDKYHRRIKGGLDALAQRTTRFLTTLNNPIVVLSDNIIFLKTLKLLCDLPHVYIPVEEKFVHCFEDFDTVEPQILALHQDVGRIITANICYSASVYKWGSGLCQLAREIISVNGLIDDSY